MADSPNASDTAGGTRTPPAERVPTAHEELARGRKGQTPASLISWVALAIAGAAALAVLVALLVYELT